MKEQNDMQLAAPLASGSALPVAEQRVTHEQLRKQAVKWLAHTKHCGVVLSEIVTAAREIPDAIGWKAGFSYVVECKASRSDWRANADKRHERNGAAAGRMRYILCPEGMIRADEVSDGWGLLWLVPDGKRAYIRERKTPELRETNLQSEVDMLVSALRRVKLREFIVLLQDGDGHEAGPAQPPDGGGASNSAVGETGREQ